jgi:hypothetical protein
MTTSGVDHSIIHVLALTMPVANGGIVYHGLNGALLYSRSTDGGETWDIQHQILPGMDSTQYTGFTNDCYAFAEPKDNIIAFAVGSYQHDLFLMKSTDWGQTFEKTLIWDHPYDSLTPTVPTNAFYCADGSVAVTLDMNGMAHVVFGICRTWFQLTAPKWRFNKLTDGVGYWNENMTGFSSDPNALDPSCGPESELVQDVSLIGWSQDGNGTWDILGEVGLGYPCIYFSLGVSSMVQLISDNQNRLFLVYTSLTETYNNGYMDYRRLWLRSSLDGGQTWGKFYHYDGENPNSIFNEYAFPSCAGFSDNYLYLTFMVDWEPGISCQGEPNYHENKIRFAKIPKDEIVGINQHNKALTDFEVSQNFPNPFTETTSIKVNLIVPANLSLEIKNNLGQKVSQTQTINGKTGINTFTIDRKNLAPGIYFYTVNSGEHSITRKMIIKY